MATDGARVGEAHGWGAGAAPCCHVLCPWGARLGAPGSTPWPESCRGQALTRRAGQALQLRLVAAALWAGQWLWTRRRGGAGRGPTCHVVQAPEGGGQCPAPWLVTRRSWAKSGFWCSAGDRTSGFPRPYDLGFLGWGIL